VPPRSPPRRLDREGRALAAPVPARLWRNVRPSTWCGGRTATRLARWNRKTSSTRRMKALEARSRRVRVLGRGSMKKNAIVEIAGGAFGAPRGGIHRKRACTAAGGKRNYARGASCGPLAPIRIGRMTARQCATFAAACNLPPRGAGAAIRPRRVCRWRPIDGTAGRARVVTGGSSMASKKRPLPPRLKKLQVATRRRRVRRVVRQSGQPSAKKLAGLRAIRFGHHAA